MLQFYTYLSTLSLSERNVEGDFGSIEISVPLKCKPCCYAYEKALAFITKESKRQPRLQSKALGCLHATAN